MKYLKWLLSFTSRTANIVFTVLLLLSLSASYISPERIWFLPFLGMLLPLLVLINLAFVVIWILRRRYFAALSLLAIAACLPQLLQLVGTNTFKAKEPEGKLRVKVMSYNVRDFDLYNWSENLRSKEEIFKTIREENADVICFQEFYNDTSASFRTVLQLQQMGYTHYFFSKELVLRNTDEWGIAIFSKYPIREQAEIMRQNFKTGYGKKPFRGMYADIDFGDTTIRFVNVHLQSIYFGATDYETIEEFRSTQNVDEKGLRSILAKLQRAFERRAQQADELRFFLDEQHMPVVVCGDFNDLPNSYVVNEIRGDRKDAFLDHSFGIGHTYNGKIPFLRIDYILTHPDFNIHHFSVVKNRMSDHFPICAELSL